MSFDKAIADLTAAVNANSELLKSLLATKQAGGASPAPTSEDKPDVAKTKRGRPAASEGATAKAKEDAYTPKYTQSEMQAAVNEVKNELGTAEAKRIIKEVGGHDRLADVVDPKKIDELYEAARALIEGGSDGDSDEDGL